MKTNMNTITRKLMIGAFVFGLFTTTATFATENDKTSNTEKEKITAVDNDLVIENWMINLDEWQIKSTIFESVINEKDIEIEKWMLNAEVPEWNYTSENIAEPDIELESWMSDLSKW